MSTVPAGSTITAVCLGTPHFSGDEWNRLLPLLDQVAPARGIPIYVNTGRDTLRDRVDNIQEVVTGFHPEITRRENIVQKSATLGITNAETRKKFTEIVELAEIEKFLSGHV